MDPGTVVMKRSSRYLCCGDTAGKVNQCILENTTSYLMYLVQLHSNDVAKHSLPNKKWEPMFSIKVILL